MERPNKDLKVNAGYLQVGLDAVLLGPETQREKNMKSKSITHLWIA